MKILSKIKRRTNEDELPRRGEYVEMDLFDTDRNPLEFPSSNDGIEIVPLTIPELPSGAPEGVLDYDTWGNPNVGVFVVSDFSLTTAALMHAWHGVLWEQASSVFTTHNLFLMVIDTKVGSPSEGHDYAGIQTMGNFNNGTNFNSRSVGFGHTGNQDISAIMQVLPPSDYQVRCAFFRNSADDPTANLINYGAGIMLVPGSYMQSGGSGGWEGSGV